MTGEEEHSYFQQLIFSPIGTSAIIKQKFPVLCAHLHTTKLRWICSRRYMSRSAFNFIPVTDTIQESNAIRSDSTDVVIFATQDLRLAKLNAIELLCMLSNINWQAIEYEYKKGWNKCLICWVKIDKGLELKLITNRCIEMINITKTKQKNKQNKNLEGKAWYSFFHN